jgi:pimeloyl-ACP methyl ester carboxylesterase
MANLPQILIITSILLFPASLTAQDNVVSNNVQGSWIGRINIGAVTLRIIFNISENYSATLDSPDQGAKDLKLGKVSLNEDSLIIPAPLLMGEYRGKIINDTLISGTWTQAGKSYTLDLSKLKEAFSDIRPQEPIPPFPYSVIEVSFMNEKAGIELAGTLTVPSGIGPFPAAVLITGSGAQNRNEELMGHKPFMLIADYLTRNGIAVLRFDDRGVGKSRGNYFASTSADFAGDASAAVKFLKSRDKINPEAVGLIGHSEGSLIASIAANQEDVAFIVSLAGPGVPGDELIYRQSADISRASGLNEDQISIAQEVNQMLFSILKKEKDNQAAYSIMAESYRRMLEKQSASEEQTKQALKQLQSSMNPITFTWLRYFIMTDPAMFWKKVKCPVLALNGDKDLQVASDVNLTSIQKSLNSGGNRKIQTMELKDLNHLFQHCKTGLPAEYSQIEETFSPGALKIISDWILSLDLN